MLQKTGKKLSKVLTTYLALTIVSSNFSLLGAGISKVLANDKKQAADTVTQSENVEFDAYFKVENENVREALFAMSEEAKVYTRVSVKNAGYLKDAKIRFLGENKENANFVLQQIQDEKEVTEGFSKENNEIALKQLEANTDGVVESSIQFHLGQELNLAMLDKTNQAVFTGTYIDNQGKEVKIEKAINLKLKWNLSSDIELQSEITKYVPYRMGEEQGVLLENTVRVIAKAKMPVKSTKVEISVPDIQKIAPSYVKVNAVSTSLTNGSGDAKEFTEQNYVYDAENKKITIFVENKVDENKNIRVGQEEALADVYEITYVYPKQAYQEEQTNVITRSGKVEVETYQDVENTKKLEKEINESSELKEKISDIVTSEIQLDTTSISKRNLYANYQIVENDTTKKVETSYHFNWKIDIGYAQLVEKISVSDLQEEFVLENRNVQNHSSYYTSSKIKKDNFLKLLGEDGVITILNNNGEVLARITKDSQADEEGNILVSYQNQESRITVQTSKPITEGSLEIVHTKKIKTDLEYEKEDVKLFSGLQIGMKTEVVMQGISEAQVAENTNKTATILLEETKTNATIKLNRESLSTMVENTDVEFRIEFNNDKNYSDLYSNPKFIIELPEYIENIAIKDYKLFSEDGLKVTNIKNEKVDGKIYITIELEGTQTKLNTMTASNGTNIILYTNIKVNMYTPSTTNEIKLYYENQNAVNYENKVEKQTEQRSTSTEYLGVATTSVNFASPTGFISATSISNFDDSGKVINSIEGSKTEKIDIYTASKIAQMDLFIMNNTGEVASQVVSLGRIPAAGNKEVLTDKDLGTTIDAVLKGEITPDETSTDKITIYYSENGQATKDLSLAENGWKTTVEDFSKVKSYLIVVTNQMAPGDTISLSYSFEIPENLEHETSIYGDFASYYTTPTGEAKTSATQKIGLTTGAGPKLDVVLTSSVPDKTDIQGMQIVNYTVKVTNTGKDIVENILIKEKIPQLMTLLEYNDNPDNGRIGEVISDKTEVSWTIKQLKAGETKEETFRLKPRRLTLAKETSNQVVVTAKNLEAEITSNVISNTINPSNLDVEITTSQMEPIVEGEEYSFYIWIRNNGETYDKEINAYVTLPEGLEYKEAYYSNSNLEEEKQKDTTGITYNEETRKLNIHLTNMNGMSVERVKVVTKASDLKEDQLKKIITYKAIMETNESIIETELWGIAVLKPKLEVKFEADPNRYVLENEKITYKLSLTNIGTNIAVNVLVEDILPDELLANIVKYGIGDNRISINSQNTIKIKQDIRVGETLYVEIVALAKKLDSNVSEKSVSNFLKISGDNISDFTTNTITHMIQINPDLDNPEDPNAPTNIYSIEGIAWLDENKNGIREENESFLSGIKAQLILAKENRVLTETYTDENGNYSFGNLEKGDYFIIFDYDVSKYDVTLYQADGSTENTNSDAISTTINEDGNLRKAAVTDTISIVRTSRTNIDIGLFENPKFDMKLDKYVSKITVQNGEGTKTYAFENVETAKADITGKQLNNSTVTIEYTFVIQNEGQIEGFVKKIADYLPSDLKFNSELNPNWYLAKDGNLYNEELKEDLIKPGEGREVKLILIKKMTEENVGLIHNTAEIIESYNEQGIQDVDSTGANKVQGEDDFGLADVYISVKTGAIVFYTTLTILVVVILGIGTYFIKKKVLEERR